MAASKKASKKKITRVLISIIFIAYGLNALWPIISKLANFEIGSAIATVVASAAAILMLLTGLFGLFGASIKVVRALAVAVCVLCSANFVLAVASLSLPLPIELLVQALLAWIYFDC